jgi:molybdopterin synthase catalytic subunit
MIAFRISSAALDTAALRAELADPGCGGFVAFEGWVRDHNEGQRVLRLEYEVFTPLAVREGERVLNEAVQRFELRGALGAHRAGALALGEIAVWIGAIAPHRDEAFRACRYIIDEVKHRLPIWKKEHYDNGDSGWVNCERCAAAGADAGADGAPPGTQAGHPHAHAHGPRR